MDEELQIFKEKVVKIIVYSGENEDFTSEWEELVFVYEDGKEELVSRLYTSSDSPEDNMLSRIGSHNILRVIQAVEINPKIMYEYVDLENASGYLN